MDTYSSSGIELYPTTWSALMAWRNEYLPLSEEYEYATYLYSTETALGRYYYTSRTYKGTKGWYIVSPNVLLPVAILEASNQLMGGNRIAMVHTHPDPGIGFHNDFPSYDSSIYGGDRIVFNAIGYQDMYVIPYKRCDQTPIIISIVDTSTWCSNYEPK